MAHFTIAQLARINRKSKPHEMSPDETGGELNIIPFLDIVVNVLMFILATIATVFTATIPVPAPSANPRPGPQPQTERLNITVKVVPNGYIVGAGGGFLQPGCTNIGPAQVTVPNCAAPNCGESARSDGYPYNFRELNNCMVAIRRHWADEVREDHSINLSPNGEVPYGVMVMTIDAVRERRSGACRLPAGGRPGNFSDPDCLFPDVTLGVLRN